MSRFKVSKFRNTEARPSRREVSPARGSPRPRPSPSPGPRAGTPPSPPAPGRPLQARARCPGCSVAPRGQNPALPGRLSLWLLRERRYLRARPPRPGTPEAVQPGRAEA